MKYDFDTIISRRGTNSYKWDTPEEENVLPMWVADMDFKTSSYIEDAVIERTKHGIFGYSEVQTPYFETVRSWMKNIMTGTFRKNGLSKRRALFLHWQWR
jgi:cystathionine beta-lyase